MSIKSVSFSSLKPGKHLVILGAIHGDEVCGPRAIARMIDALNKNMFELRQGSITFVPICNPKAYALNERFFDRNLNRKLYPKDETIDYEDKIGNILCKILDQADALLDLHSYQSPGGPFCFLGGSSQEEIDFCKSLGVSDFIYGWEDAFSKNDKLEDPRQSMGTTEYTRSKGGIATTLECGQHLNADNANIGYRAIINAMAYMNLIEIPRNQTKKPQKHSCFKMDQLFLKEAPGKFVKPWKHLDKVQKGDTLAIYESGQQLTAPKDGVIVLPKNHPEHVVGTEWFFFAVETPFPQAGDAGIN
ncbi:MAG: succinylglutamate desuccinylase/aspartoacylase family protein [Oligoflexales bacterium]|nr:succinylglutamate desuccinylase/aspartoacylase family protein [Oligoflexales bacterium]